VEQDFFKKPKKGGSDSTKYNLKININKIEKILVQKIRKII